MVPGMSLFGPDSSALYANIRVYGLFILAVISVFAYFGEKHVRCRLFI